MDYLEAILTNRLYLNVNSEFVYYKSPSISLKYKASLIYHEVVEDCLYQEWLTDKQIRQILVQEELVSANVETNLKELDNNIDETKVQLYKSAINPKEGQKIRKRLQMMKDKKEEILNNLHRYDYLTVDGFANLIKSQYIIQKSVFKGKKLYLNQTNADLALIEAITIKINRARPSYSEIRKLARNDEWSGIWRASKGRPFKGEPFNWTDEQRNIVLLTQMYESVYKHPDCPPDNVIEDDDMLDGWLIFQRKKLEREKKTKNIENTVEGLGKQKGDEQFIFTDSPEVAAEIEELNDANAKMTKRQRQNVINQKGEAKDLNFIDRQLEVNSQSNEAFKQAVRK